MVENGFFYREIKGVGVGIVWFGFEVLWFFDVFLVGGIVGGGVGVVEEIWGWFWEKVGWFIGVDIYW